MTFILTRQDLASNILFRDKNCALHICVLTSSSCQVDGLPWLRFSLCAHRKESFFTSAYERLELKLLLQFCCFFDNVFCSPNQLKPQTLNTHLSWLRMSLVWLCGPLGRICELTRACVLTTNQQQLTPAWFGGAATHADNGDAAGCFFFTPSCVALTRPTSECDQHDSEFSGPRLRGSTVSESEARYWKYQCILCARCCRIYTASRGPTPPMSNKPCFGWF